MFKTYDSNNNETTVLKDYLQKSNSIATKSKIFAEWNLNLFENISIIGNYKNRPTSATDYSTISSTYVFEDANTVNPTWYGYTDYDTTIDGGYTDISQTPVVFLNSNERQKSLMSLEDCFKKFRPRSGINKLRYLVDKKQMIPVNGDNSTIFSRPRYYAASKDDTFKYWSSFRIQNNAQYGISTATSPYLINDAAPFIVYKNLIPTNKIVIKLQTNVSKIDNGLSIDATSPTNKDPYYIASTTNYKSTPLSWKIQILDSGNNWKDIYTTTSDQFTSDSGWDGYFQLSYGITNIPSTYTTANNFSIVGTLSSASILPNIQDSSMIGQAYLVKTSNTEKGTLYIYNGQKNSTIINNYDAITPNYGWYKSEESATNSQLYITELDKTLAPQYIDGTTVYREFQYIKGLRIVANSMVNPNTTFDFIELSPRLAADITDITTSFSIKKYASDLGVSSLPVGQLIASTGSLSVFDYNQVLNSNNPNSILNMYDATNILISTFVSKNIQLKFYENISSVKQSDGTYKNYYIPIKTLYADGFPTYDDSNRNVSITLRDFSFYLESFTCPELLLKEASLSFIVSTILDSIGFSNYQFLRTASPKPDPIIPYFMVSPNKTVMQILQDLAIATQATMFFDEANNFVVMSRDYLIPESKSIRDKDITLYGDDDKNTGNLTNISNVASESNDIYNDGKIVYYNRYIRKKSNQISRYKLLDKYQETGYEKVILWALDASGQKILQSKNEEDLSVDGYPITAMPIAADLLTEVPKVNKNGQIINNEIDFGDNAWWLQRYKGYLYSNGEIIQYDAIQYVITSTPVTGITGTITNGSNQILITSQNALGLSIGQTINLTSGSGISGTILAISSDLKTVTISNNATSTGSITFDAQNLDYNFWITNTDDYSKYYAKLSLGQKMYKTGKVRIYTQPYFNADKTFKEGDVEKHGRMQFGTSLNEHKITLDTDWTTVQTPLVTNYQYIFSAKQDKTIEEDTTLTSKINSNKDNLANVKMSKPVSAIGNFLSAPKFNVKTSQTTYSSTIQASSLVLTGPNFSSSSSNGPSMNYVKKDLTSTGQKYDIFGTRLRLVGSIYKNYKYVQYPYGSFPMTYALKDSPTNKTINASSAGMAIMTNQYGEGYYYELSAIDYTNIKGLETTNAAETNTLFFYRMDMVKDGLTTTTLAGTFNADKTVLTASANGVFSLPGNTTITPAVGKLLEIRNSTQAGLYTITSMGSSTSKWILTKVTPVLKPKVLYSDFRNILVDTGVFVKKQTGIKNTQESIYDIAIKIQNINDKTYVFNLFYEGGPIASYSDTNPITYGVSQNISLFVRGSSKAMFDNVYAIKTVTEKETNVSKPMEVFNGNTSDNLTLNKYSLNPLIKSEFLSKISPKYISDNKIYYEEFGAIMRECSYFNVKFDKAYPALRSLFSPQSASLGGFLVTGYYATPYRAEFLLFNTTDFVLNLGSNNDYKENVSISGIAFTQESAKDLTVDDFYNRKSNFSINSDYNSTIYKNNYINIKNNRLTYGTKSFTIDSPYIQNLDTASTLMDFIINRVSKPRKAVAVEIFSMPIIQLGDIVDFSYNTQKVLPNAISGNNYIVYGIEYARKDTGPSTILYLSEVV